MNILPLFQYPYYTTQLPENPLFNSTNFTEFFSYPNIMYGLDPQKINISPELLIFSHTPLTFLCELIQYTHER